MAPYRLGFSHMDFRFLGFPFDFADDEQATLLEPKTGLADGVVTWVAVIPLLVWVFICTFPMVAGLSFFAIAYLMGDVGMDSIDIFGSILMIIPFYFEGAVTLYLYRHILPRLNTFLKLFAMKLGSLMSPGKYVTQGKSDLESIRLDGQILDTWCKFQMMSWPSRVANIGRNGFTSLLQSALPWRTLPFGGSSWGIT